MPRPTLFPWTSPLSVSPPPRPPTRLRETFPHLEDSLRHLETFLQDNNLQETFRQILGLNPLATVLPLLEVSLNLPETFLLDNNHQETFHDSQHGTFRQPLGLQ